MRPAVCSVCGKPHTVDTNCTKGNWVKFKDYDQQHAESLSHPNGLEYFCGEHLSAALKLTEMDSNDALRELKNMYPDTQPIETKMKKERPWWKRWLWSERV